jgi:hypothetical protein
LLVFVEAVKGILDLDKVSFGESLAPYEITEIEECTKYAHHVLRDMALDCS